VNALSARLARVVALLKDPRTPKLPRLLVLLACAYLVWPLDLLPDFAIPVVGFLDDLTLLWLSVGWLFKKGAAPGPGEQGEAGAGKSSGG
jgi:uncharacterized membrane protein YkvA (DUF1232 family)